MDTVEERVYRGVGLLDRMKPGWADEIDLDRLDMSSVEDCILGQLFDTYSDGVEALGLPLFGDAVHNQIQSDDCLHGFDNACFHSEVTFDDLTREWEELIITRRSFAAMLDDKRESAHV